MKLIKKHISEVSEGDVVATANGDLCIALVDAHTVDACGCGKKWSVWLANSGQTLCLSAPISGPDGMVDIVITQSKHISQVVKGDVIIFADEVCTAVSDGYLTKTDNGKEWNVEVKGRPYTNYIYASEVECGMLEVLERDEGNPSESAPSATETATVKPEYEAKTWQEAVATLADRLGWSVTVAEEHEWEFEIFSGAGRDFVVTVQGDSPDALVHALQEDYNNYDVCEETYIWLDSTGHGTNGAPYDMMDVYQDSVQCREMLGELLSEIRTLFANRGEC